VIHLDSGRLLAGDTSRFEEASGGLLHLDTERLLAGGASRFGNASGG
jgi:hypothetical protein